MKPQQVEELVRYRILQAHETLQEAEILVREGFWRGALNRAYYVMFYAVLALTIIRRVPTSKHAGVIAFFDREFVKTKIFPRDLSRMFHLAFDHRQTSDYGELGMDDHADAEETLSNARMFLDAIETYLKNIQTIDANNTY